MTLMGAEQREVSVQETRANLAYSLALVAFLCLFLRDIGGGAFRYYTTVFGLGPLWFLPDAAALGFLCFFTVHKFMRGGASALAIPAVFVFFSLIGFFVTESWTSVISACKMVLPLFVGFGVGEFRDKVFGKRRLYWGLFAVACLGVFLSQFISFPWVGFQTVEFGVLRTAANQRWMDGVYRATGFASDSTAGAFAIMMTAMLLMRGARREMKLLVTALCVYPLYLTTSRTAWVAFFVFCCLLILKELKRKDLFRWAILFILSFFFLSPFVMPSLFGFLHFEDVPRWAFSFVDRIQNTWVNPYRFVWSTNPALFLTGMGLGSVGYPIHFSSVMARSLFAVDNFMFANFLMFGVAGLAATYYLLRRAYENLSRENMCLLASLIFYGVAIQGYGQPGYSFFVGLLLSWFSLKDETT